jgi:hypothetical protein
MCPRWHIDGAEFPVAVPLLGPKLGVWLILWVLRGKVAVQREYETDGNHGDGDCRFQVRECGVKIQVGMNRGEKANGSPRAVLPLAGFQRKAGPAGKQQKAKTNLVAPQVPW